MVKPPLNELVREILVTLMNPRWGWSWHHHVWGWRIDVVAEGLEVSSPGIGPVVVPFHDLHDMVLVLARVILSGDVGHQRWVIQNLAARRP